MFGNRGLRQTQVLGQFHHPVLAEQEVLKDQQACAFAESVEQASGCSKRRFRRRVGSAGYHRHLAMIVLAAARQIVADFSPAVDGVSAVVKADRCLSGSRSACFDQMAARVCDEGSAIPHLPVECDELAGYFSAPGSGTHQVRNARLR